MASEIFTKETSFVFTTKE